MPEPSVPIYVPDFGSLSPSPLPLVVATLWTITSCASSSTRGRPNPIEVVLCANDERAVGDGVTGQGPFPKIIPREHFESGRCFHHGAQASFVLKINPSFCRDGGCRVIAS